MLYATEMQTPLGVLTLVMTERGLCGVHFGDVELTVTDPYMHTWMRRYFATDKFIRDDRMARPYVEQLAQYFARQRESFDLPLVIQGTPFQQKVWTALQNIPYGETRSYKDIAEMIGSPKAVRAVGGANNKNPISIIIPCHRVIGHKGDLTGYGGGLDKKVLLLDLERSPSKNEVAETI